MVIIAGASGLRNFAFSPLLSLYGPVRDARTSSGASADESGRITLSPASTVRTWDVSGRLGFLAEDTRSNYIPRSGEALQWTKTGTATAVASPGDGSPLGPAVRISCGSGSANKITTPNTSGHPVSTALVASVLIRRVSTTGVLVVELGNSQGRFEIDLSLVPDGWQWVSSLHPAVTSTPVALVTGAGAGSIDAAFYGKTTTVTFDVAHVQVEAGTYATSPIPTTTTTVARGRSWPTTPAAVFTATGVTFGARYTRHAGTAEVTFGLGEAVSTAGSQSIIVTDSGSTIKVQASVGAAAAVVSANVNVDANVLQRAVTVIATTSTVKLYLNGVEVASITIALTANLPWMTSNSFVLPKSSAGMVVTHRAFLLPSSALPAASTGIIGSLA